MKWLALLANLIKLTMWLIAYMEKRGIISKAEASVLRRSQEDTNARIQNVQDARARIANLGLDRLRDDDGHRRD